MNRRQLLKCFGGALLALPALEACAPPVRESAGHEGKTRSGLSGATAKRLVTMAVWNGVVPRLWYPRGGTETSFTLSTMLQDLAPHQANLLIMKGLDNNAASKTAGVDGHHEGEASLFTGRESLKIGDLDFLSRGISVDQALANHLSSTGVVTRFSSIQAGVPGSGNAPESISFVADNQDLAAQRSPRALFNLLFQDAGQSQQAIARAHARRKSILDGSIEDYAKLSTRVSGEDKRRVDAHLTAVRDLELRLASGVACDPTTFAQTGNGVDGAWKAFLDIVVLALSCDLTRVASLSFDHGGGGGISYPWLGIGDEWHELSHSVVSEDPTGGSATDKFVAIQRWHAQQMAYFVSRLKATTTADGGTLFDETVIVRGSELSFNHCHYDIPFLLLAGDKTPFATGRYVNLAPSRAIVIPNGASDVVYAEGVPHNNLLVTLLRAFGTNATTFGDPTICTGNVDARLFKA